MSAQATSSNNGNRELAFYGVYGAKFYNSKDKERKTPFNRISGKFVGITFKTDTIPNKNLEIKRANFNFIDDKERSVLSVSEDNDHFRSLVSFLLTADLDKEVTVVISDSERVTSQGNPIGNIFVAQGVKEDGKENYLKSYFTKDGPNQLPKWKKMVDGTKTIWLKGEYQEALHKAAEELSAKVANTPIPAPAPAQTSVGVKQEENVPAFVEEPFDDGELPF